MKQQKEMKVVKVYWICVHSISWWLKTVVQEDGYI